VSESVHRPQPPQILDSQSLAAFPLKLRNSTHYGSNRIALIGDAAHTIHPLAGQGLNMGLADAEHLSRILRKAYEEGDDLGSSHVIEEYTRSRYTANLGILAAVDGMHTLFHSKWTAGLRSMGMNALNKNEWLKGLIMGYAQS
jgi:ubiquinone biosynthesis monooxygenase Coq6